MPTITDDPALDPFARAREAILRAREPYGLLDDKWRQKCPEMWKFFTDRTYPGGKSREVPRLTIIATAEGWDISATDYGISMKLMHKCAYADDLWKALSRCWTHGEGKWVEVRSGDAYKRKKADEERRLATQPDELYNLAKGGGDPKKRGAR